MVLETDLEERAKHGQVGLGEKATFQARNIFRDLWSELRRHSQYLGVIRRVR